MKKFLGIICFLLIIGSYFLYDYRTKSILESKQGIVAEDTKDYSDSPLSEKTREMVFDFWKYTGKDTIQANNGLQVMGEEKQLPNKITTLYFYEQNGTPYLSVSEDYYFNPGKAVSYTYLDDNLIIYYGSNGVQQNLIDTARMSVDFDFLNKYNQEGKPVIKLDTKEKSYEIK